MSKTAKASAFRPVILPNRYFTRAKGVVGRWYIAEMTVLWPVNILTVRKVAAVRVAVAAVMPVTAAKAVMISSSRFPRMNIWICCLTIWNCRIWRKTRSPNWSRPKTCAPVTPLTGCQPISISCAHCKTRWHAGWRCRPAKNASWPSWRHNWLHWAIQRKMPVSVCCWRRKLPNWNAVLKRCPLSTPSIYVSIILSNALFLPARRWCSVWWMFPAPWISRPRTWQNVSTFCSICFWPGHTKT